MKKIKTCKDIKGFEDCCDSCHEDWVNYFYFPCEYECNFKQKESQLWEVCCKDLIRLEEDE